MRTIGKAIGIGKVAKVAEIVQETIKIRWIETAAIDAETLGAKGIPATTGELVAALRGVRIDTGLADPIAVAARDEDASLFAERYAAALGVALLVNGALLRAFFALDADTTVAPAHARRSALGVGYAIATMVVDARATRWTGRVGGALDLLAMSAHAAAPGAIAVGAARRTLARSIDAQGKRLVHSQSAL